MCLCEPGHISICYYNVYHSLLCVSQVQWKTDCVYLWSCAIEWHCRLLISENPRLSDDHQRVISLLWRAVSVGYQNQREAVCVCLGGGGNNVQYYQFNKKRRKYQSSREVDLHTVSWKGHVSTVLYLFTQQSIIWRPDSLVLLTPHFSRQGATKTDLFPPSG